jgi:hypothetical protein
MNPFLVFPSLLNRFCCRYEMIANVLQLGEVEIKEASIFG